MKTNRYEGLDSLVKKQSVKKRSGDEQAEDKTVTPNGIVLAALRDIYGVGPDKKKLNAFTRAVVSLLSALATGGQDQNLLGKDMDEFFRLYVNTLNLCGRMKQALEDNGIEFDINGDGD